MNNVKYDVNDMPKPGLLVGLSFQHLFAMFGATVLVPILVGIDPAIALFSSGLGTLAHLTVTKYKIPAYMGSSFAYIAAMQMLMKTDGIAAVGYFALKIAEPCSLILCKEWFKLLGKLGLPSKSVSSGAIIN